MDTLMDACMHAVSVSCLNPFSSENLDFDVLKVLKFRDKSANQREQIS